MLKGVMDFSRPAAPVLKVTDLNVVAEKAFRTHAEVLAAHNVHADLDLDRSLPEIALDENQFLQVITNLLRNAADSMPNGGALTLRTRRDGQMALLQVTDTGTGIPPDLMERIFSPFFTTKASGTGLGLAVSRKIVDDHGGRVEVQSKLGEGTTFSIYLPLHRPATAVANAPTEAGAKG
jgi:signal transduction histidine kinase